MRDCLTPIRTALDLSPLPSTALRLVEWPILPAALLPYDALLRYRRLTALLLALMEPTGLQGGQLALPLQLLVQTAFATLAMDAAGAKDAAAAVLALPDLYRCALQLLQAAVRRMGGQLLGQAELVVGMLLDVHRRCSDNRSLHELLPLVYDVLTSLLRLPLSPALLAFVVRTALPTLLGRVMQPFEVRQLRAQSSTQRMAVQLQDPQQRKSTSASSLPSEGQALSFHQPLSDLIATAALSTLHQLLLVLPYIAPDVRQPWKNRVDATLLTLALSISASSEAAPVPLRCGVYRCLMQAVVGGGRAGANGAPSALLPYALRVFEEGAKEGEDEEVRAVCQQGRLQCDALASREGGIGQWEEEAAGGVSGVCKGR